MKALGFLIRRQIINFIKGQLKKPALLVLYVVAFGFMLFSIMVSGDSAQSIQLPAETLPAGLIVLFTVMMFIQLRSALSRGTTVFGVEDVNFLFTSPVRPQITLLYGVVRQMGMSLIIMFVLLFQIVNLRMFFAMTTQSIIVLFIAWFLLSVLTQVIAMCLYALLAPREGARRVAGFILNGCAIALVLVIGVLLFRNPSIEGALSLLSSSWLRVLPLSGWLSGAVLFAMEGSWIFSIGLMLISVLLGIGVFALVLRADPDYYEDVLDITQEMHERRQAAKQPSAQANTMIRRNVRAGKSGLTMGWGASAFFFKQLREQRREGILFLDFRTLMLAMMSGILCVTMSQVAQSEPDVLSTLPLYVMLGGLVYGQLIFNVTSGRFTQEMLKPYLYLAPISPRQKILLCNLMPAIKGAVDGLICFVGAGIILGLPMVQCVASGLLLGIVTLFFTGAGLLADWAVGEAQSKILTMLLYFLCVMLLIGPAVAIFIILLIALPTYTLIAYGAVAGYLLIVTALLFLLLGGRLHSSETAA